MISTIKNYTLGLVSWLLFLQTATAQMQLSGKQYDLPQHPRLLWLKGEENQIKATIKADSYWQKAHQYVIDDAEALMNLPPVENTKIGFRLLDTSREFIRRIFCLAYSFRITGDMKYFDRSEKEMLAVAAFDSWNPGHFLDVGEMTLGMAVGYDWLYNELPEASRTAIKQAILIKGIEPSLNEKHNDWLNWSNNWNQVCNTGIAYGALVTYEDHPELSQKIIERAIITIQLPMKQYEPDGDYPEGYGYWGYGTTYNVLFLSALEVAFGTDFGLSKKSGFLNTASYLQHMTNPKNKHFNYADCSPISEFNPAMVWFAQKTKNASLLYVEKQKLTGYIESRNRFFPAALIWGKGIQIAKSHAPKQLIWVGHGKNPVALYRTSWTDQNAIYVGFKGGSPSVSHAHMDVGSFVMASGGISWGLDLGMQDYNSLESKGIKTLFNSSQTSDRWTVFRNNTFSHNTLVINNKNQDVKGVAPITSHSNKPSFMNAVTDLTGLYKGVSKLHRGVAIVKKSYVMVRDEIEVGAEGGITLRWSMVTPAAVKILSPSSAELTKDGKKLLLRVQGAEGITMKTWSTEPTTAWDAPNPGTQIVGYEVYLPANSKQSLTVSLMPEKTVKTKQISLANWPKSELND